MKQFLSFLLLSLSLTLQAHVAKNERALIVISEVDEKVAPDMKNLYRAIEKLTQVSAKKFLSSEYAEIKYLVSQNATVPFFKSAVEELANRQDIHAIDVILSLHGWPNMLLFFDRYWNVSDIANEFSNIANPEVKKKLRIMYNLSCYGASHNASFLSMGFDVSAGSVAINANSEVEFVPFMLRWRDEKTFSSSFALSNSNMAIAIADAPVKLYGKLKKNSLTKTNSKKVFAGDTSVRIYSDPQ